jgi:hypothetical protein
VDRASRLARYSGFTFISSLLSLNLDMMNVTERGRLRSSSVFRLNRSHSSCRVLAQYSVSFRRMNQRILPLLSGMGYPVFGSIHQAMNFDTHESASGLQVARTNGFTPQVERFLDSI